MFVLKVGWLSRDYTALYSRIQKFEETGLHLAWLILLTPKMGVTYLKITAIQNGSFHSKNKIYFVTN
jgi:hypothetical protein